MTTEKRKRTPREEALHRVNVEAQKAEVEGNHEVARALWDMVMKSIKARGEQ